MKTFSDITTNLGISIVLKLLSDERIKGVPVILCDVPSNTPQVAENERRTQDWVQLVGVLVQVWSAATEQEGLQETTKRGHLTDVHLYTGKNSQQVKIRTGKPFITQVNSEEFYSDLFNKKICV